MAATTIINWAGDTNKPPLTIKTEPDPINVGDAITIRLFSAYPHKLISPYGGLSRSRASANVQLNEIVELSGSNDITTEYPIASLVSVVAAIPLVDEMTRAIVVNGGQPLGSMVSVINQRLVINSALKLYGSIRVVYRTFDAQCWTHKPFTQKGNALLFAQNLSSLAYENVPLTIGEKTTATKDSIRIEGYPMTAHYGTQPYASFIVFPASKEAVILTDYGSVTKKTAVSYLIEREQINFSGKTASASFAIDDLINFKGYFFDAQHRVISPTFTVSDGELVASVECYGTGYLTYHTQGTVYDYNAQVTIDNTGFYPSYSTVVGSIFAFDKEKTGIAASYQIPLAVFASPNRENLLEVYREVLVVGKEMFEMPDDTPAYPNGNDYVHYPSALPNTKPPIGEAYAVTRWVHETVSVNGGVIGNEQLVVSWFMPTGAGEAFAGVVYKLNDKVPTTATPDYPQRVIDELNTAKAALKTKYGIA